jgi:hypothetical protein
MQILKPVKRFAWRAMRARWNCKEKPTPAGLGSVLNAVAEPDRAQRFP